MTDKLTRVRELAKIIEDAESELAELVGATPKPKRGRPPKPELSEAPKEGG